MSKAKITLLIIFGATLLLLLVKFFSILSIPENKNIVRIERAYPTMGSSYPKTKPAQLFVGKPVTQKFVASRNNLTQINIAFEDFPTFQKDEIVLTLRDENCQPIHSHTFGRVSFWHDTIYTRFNFPPIPDSKEKTYCLQAELRTDEPRKKDLPKIMTFRSENDSFFNSGEKGGKDFNRQSLLFKSAYSEGGAWSNMNSLVERMSQHKPSFFKGVSLEIIIILSFLFIIFLVTLFVLIL
ncbi:MAG: hypothetical protein UY41_C0042G0004 [Candidatus Moranbacteria bacterium GW2011_GWE1_49_15]|nr:MAG: hypothetical protein UY41_C0042G0004 [Candidatus Moranbacteria bacterium GW2011_GWE1_49_15]HBP01255.1 hypothetical protein [Candidatus Moranbacteria bacterium]